ncbi:MFS transporter, partial [Salmonella enterica subsp. enterica serovar Newport]
SNAPIRLSYQPRPNRRTRSDICIQLRYLRPVNGLPG